MPWYLDLACILLALGTAYGLLYCARHDYDWLKCALCSAGILNTIAAFTYGFGFWASFCVIAFMVVAAEQYWGSGLETCRNRGVMPDTIWSGYVWRLGAGYVPVYMYLACKIFGAGTLDLEGFLGIVLVAAVMPFIPTPLWIVARCDISFAFSSFKSRAEITSFKVKWWDESFNGMSNSIMNEMIAHKLQSGEWVEMTLSGIQCYFCCTWLNNAINRIRERVTNELRMKVDEAVSEVAGVLDAPKDVVKELLSLPDNGLFVCRFPEGLFYVSEDSHDKIRICLVCGAVSVAESETEDGLACFCSDYCRETAHLCGLECDSLPRPQMGAACCTGYEFACHEFGVKMGAHIDIKEALKEVGKKQVYKKGREVISEGVADTFGESMGTITNVALRGRDVFFDIKQMCDEEISGTQCAKNIVQHTGGIGGGAIGAKIGFLFGAVLPVPGTAFLGGAVGGWIGNRYGSQMAKAFADLFGDDDAVFVLAMVRDEIRFVAVTFKFEQQEIRLFVKRINQEILDDRCFVPSVVKVGNDLARCYVARRILPIAAEIVSRRK